MPIGVVSTEEFEAELEKTNVVIVEKPRPGRSDGDLGVPESLQKIIGETAVIDGRGAALDLAKMYGLSASSVSAYANGATSTNSYNEPKPAIKNHIEKAKQRIAKSARGKLNYALEQLTEEKFAGAKLRDISGAARDMASIIKDMEPKSNNDEASQKTPFVIYAPTFRQENYFDTIQVNE